MSEPRLAVGVLGAAGYVGGEMLRLLVSHPNVGEIEAVSRSRPGRPWSEAHPAFAFETRRTFTPATPGELARRCDVVFVALGHGESARIMRELVDADPRLIVDLAADFRLTDVERYRATWGEHPCFDLTSEFVYGLPEANRGSLRGAKRIANPGCMATASELCLLPLASAGLLPERPAVFAITGSSGAGAEPKPTTHHPFRAANLFIYKPLSHQHEAEIERVVSERAGRPVRPRMIAHSGPFVRGIHASAHVAGESLAGHDVAALFRDAYANEPFTHVTDSPPSLAMAQGTNHAFVHVTVREREALVACVIDNLGKGAAGQAIQNMNIALGLPEAAGLTAPGFFPY